MGAFGGGKKVSISSVVYNMAGPEEDRANFLKTVVVSKVIAPANKQTMGEHIVNSYLHGPGMDMRAFGRWSRTQGYNDVIGMTPSRLGVGNNLDLDQVADVITDDILPAGQTAQVQTATIGSADYSYWVDQYVAENYPDQIGTEYESDFDEGSNTITITFVDTSTATFSPAGYNPYGAYLYATYISTTEEEEGDTIVGSDVILGEGDPWPDTTDWIEESYVVTPTTATLTTTVVTDVTYSDATPPEHSENSSDTGEDYDVISGEWSREKYMGQHPTLDATYSIRSWMFWTQTGSITSDEDVDVTVEDIGGGVTKTTTVTTTTESLVLNRSYHVDTQEVIHKTWGPLNVFIYEYNTGNPSLDGMFQAPESFGVFFPFIPVRIDNQFVSSSWFGSDYPWCKRAYRKAFKDSYDSIIETITDNPSLGDIDYAYVVFGVSLNTKESASLRYIYELFQEIMLGQSMGSGNMSAWHAQYVAAQDSVEAWEAWKDAQSDPGDPLFGAPEPTRLPYPQPPGYMLAVESGTRTDLNFNMRMYWAGVDETIGSGTLDPGKKVGELWFEKMGTESFQQSLYSNGEYVLAPPVSYERVRLCWQYDNDTWRTLDIWGLNHQNFIYGGRAVTTYAFEALDDEDDSGFIIPLHEEIYKQMPIKPATQASTALAYMVFNCYTVVKEKWYETTLFKILIVIVVIAISIWIGGAGVGLAGGILGSNVGVGTALGFTGVAAAIAGAVANAVAAMILTQIITYASTAAFGEKVGAIVGVIASIVAIQVGTSFATGGDLAGALTNLMQPENLGRLTMAAGDGYSQYLRAQSRETLLQAQQIMSEYQEQSAELSEQIDQVFGGSKAFLDPLTITSATYGPVLETADAFLQRTLLTGPDISEASHQILTDFTDLSLQTPLPGGDS